MPCQSRWSGARFNHVATVGANRSAHRSRNDDASTTNTSTAFVERGDERHIGVPDRERLAAGRDEHVGDHRRDRRLAVGAGDRDHGRRAASQSVARSSSLTTGIPRLIASTITGWCSGTPGLGTSMSTNRASRSSHDRGAGARRRHEHRRPRVDARSRVGNGFAGHPHAVHQGPHQSATPMWMKSA